MFTLSGCAIASPCTCRVGNTKVFKTGAIFVHGAAEVFMATWLNAFVLFFWPFLLRGLCGPLFVSVSVISPPQVGKHYFRCGSFRSRYGYPIPVQRGVQHTEPQFIIFIQCVLSCPKNKTKKHVFNGRAVVWHFI